MPFVHLHVHSQYSILDGATKIPAMIDKAIADEMPALALTDHGNMFGIKLFYDTCRKKGLKPILGCEAYVARRSMAQKSETIDRSGNHLILLAKNLQGYHNLVKLISEAHIQGQYYRPRIDKEILERYHEGLIVSSACLGGEISQKIMAGDIRAAEESAAWFKNLFGDDYYLEVMIHPTNDPKLHYDVYENQVLCNKEIFNIAKKLGIKVIATNDVHFLNEQDAEAHDLLICLNTGKDLNDPSRMRYTRQEWFKTTGEMEKLWKDYPEVLANTVEIADKVEEYKLDSDPIMPVFPIPENFGSEKDYADRYSENDLKKEFGEERYQKLSGDYNKILRIKFESDYLKHLAYKGAKRRWKEGISNEVQERIDFELDTIKTMGFPGYFLIVQDFIQAARDMGVIVGPGRGSAAGSVVAYCLGITNINPVKYDLLFERFLNPDRISMPDIDIDFDDEGRQKVLEWVTQKYGDDKVSHIVTFGSMAAKMSIKDVARVLKLELSESNRLARMVPDTPKITLKKAYDENPDLKAEKESTNSLIPKTLAMAEILEGSVRQTGVHACGILISRDPLTDHIPVMPTPGESLLTTQYDGHFVEPIGLLKMDFLGLRTLSIIKTCIQNIKLTRGEDLDIDNIPLDDEETFALFSRGETTGLFQFESPGMKKHLRALQPNRFEDLVAMNALYRPGPMEYIPQFIKRKHGEEPIEYDHPLMEPYLKDTYGITVYQEQVMLQSRALGNFTRGMSDTLRKAMGKKQKEMMDKLKTQFIQGCKDNPKFVEGCANKNLEELVNKIWKDWEEFAKYAFNKSHSVCYAYIAYQTGYLKAHYPAEFMAANLSNNLAQIDKVTTYMEECKRMGLEVLSPDVNESFNDFAVNKQGQIRFGMAAIKGVGEVPSSSIIEERTKNGPFKDIYDFFKRINYKCVNRRTIENLVTAGGLDSFSYHRAQILYKPVNGSSILETLIQFGQNYQEDKNRHAMSLFGDCDGFEISEPAIPLCQPWTDYEKAKKEKEMIGIYLTSHPLDQYKLELNILCCPIEELNNADFMSSNKGRTVTIGGIITNIKEGKTKIGKDFAIVTVEDFNSSHEFAFFGRDYINYHLNFINESFVYIEGKIAPSNNNETKLRFNITRMGSLDEITNDAIKSITLQVNVENLTIDFINEIHNIFLHDTTRDSKQKKNRNEDEIVDNKKLVELKIQLFDNFNNSLNMYSRTCKVICSKDLMDYFNNNEAIRLKIN